MVVLLLLLGIDVIGCIVYIINSIGIWWMFYLELLFLLFLKFNEIVVIVIM